MVYCVDHTTCTRARSNGLFLLSVDFKNYVEYMRYMNCGSLVAFSSLCLHLEQSNKYLQYYLPPFTILTPNKSTWLFDLTGAPCSLWEHRESQSFNALVSTLLFSFVNSLLFFFFFHLLFLKIIPLFLA